MKHNAKRVTAEEIKQIQLEMLDEIDAFCRDHGIRYSLAFGTLLGAIRHKGYIPWDDDVDIEMPLPDMIRFKEEFKSENLTYHDIDIDSKYEYHFSRISHNPTYSQRGLIDKSYGVCIDLYPVAGISEDPDAFIQRVRPLLTKRMKYVRWRKRIIRRFPVKTIPGFKRSLQAYRAQTLFSCPYEQAKYYFHAGSLTRVNIFEYDAFKEMCDVEFEGHKYMSVACWHDYLTHCFNDYMQLPPEEERRPGHGFVCYWR